MAQIYAPAYVLESAWKALLGPICGFPSQAISLSDENQPTLHPNLTITTSEIEEIVTPGSGVFLAKTKIQYETKLVQTTPAQAEQAFGTIISNLYWSDGGTLTTEQSLAVRLTSAYPNFTCYGITGMRITQAVKTNDKLWQKSIEMDVRFMSRDNV